jgi:predicted nucleic acid-binding protein
VLRRTFGWVPALDDPWRQVLAVQRGLIKIDHHRGPSPMDIIIALTAEAHRLTVAHVDADFDAIAKVRPGIAMVRIDQPTTP